MLSCISQLNDLDVVAAESAYSKGEKALWRAVITQALMDAGSNSTKKDMRIIQAQAIAWLGSGGADLAEVCALADWDMDYVRSKAKKAIRRGCMWRNYNPKSFNHPAGAKARRVLSKGMTSARKVNAPLGRVVRVKIVEVI